MCYNYTSNTIIYVDNSRFELIYNTKRYTFFYYIYIYIY